MAIYWRLEDIPELRAAPGLRRRRLWREAVTRSTTPRRLLASIATRFVAALLGGGLSLWLLPSISPLWIAISVMLASGLAWDVSIRTPAARRWLREHAHELDRHVLA